MSNNNAIMPYVEQFPQYLPVSFEVPNITNNASVVQKLKTIRDLISIFPSGQNSDSALRAVCSSFRNLKKLPEALKTTRYMQSSEGQCWEIAKDYAKKGKLQKAVEVRDRYCFSCPSLASERIAEGLAEGGQIEDSINFIASNLLDGGKGFCLRNAVIGVSNFLNNGDDLMKLKLLADRISDTYYRVQAFTSISKALDKAQNNAEAKEILDEAYSLNKANNSHTHYYSAILDLITAREEINDFDGARKIVPDYKILSSGIASFIYTQTIIKQAEAGDIDGAKREMAKLENGWDPRVLAAIGKAQAKNHDFEGALETYTLLKEKSSGWAENIIDEMFKYVINENSFNDCISFLEKYTEGRNRDKKLYEVVKKQATQVTEENLETKIQEILYTISRISDEENIAYSKGVVARLFKKHYRDDLAMETRNSIDPKYSGLRRSLLDDFAVHNTNQGRQEEALETEFFDRPHAIREMALNYSKKGETEKALAILPRVNDICCEVLAAEVIASDQAKRDFVGSLRTISRIRRNYAQVSALGYVAEIITKSFLTNQKMSEN